VLARAGRRGLETVATRLRDSHASSEAPRDLDKSDLLVERSDLEKRPLAGMSLCVRQRVELNGARSNPRAGVELVRLGALHNELLRRASVDSRGPRSIPAKVSPVLETVTLVLERARIPMRAREIHAAAEQLAGEPLRWTSVKAALAADAEGSEARFERVRRGYYRIRERVVPLCE
jgi:hypothetical protein